MDSTQLVTILRYGGYGCLVLAALLLALSIWLFFRLNIREIRDELTGKARETAISEMGENYATTGSLRTASGEIEAEQDGKKDKKSGKAKKAKKAKKQAPPPQQPPQPEPEATGVMRRPEAEPEATGVMTQPDATNVLNNADATNVLTQQPPTPPEQRPTAPLQQRPVNTAFRVTKEIMLVHTDDQIP